MLYVSTRNRTNSFTAHRALHEDRAPDGGMFVPFQLPFFTDSLIRAMQEAAFGEVVANLLNLFFSTRLTGWDVESCIGRHPIKLVAMNHRLIIAEVWHNLESDCAYTEQVLYNRLCGSDGEQVTDWAKIAIRIALLFGIFAELSASGLCQMDISVTAEDFTTPMAVWYARRMGLPISTIICCGDESSAAWDLIHRGELNTNAAFNHAGGLERLIYGTLGLQETLRYLDVCHRRGTYQISELAQQTLGSGLFAAVVGSTRVPSVISSVYRTSGYILDPHTAVSYGGLQDYRARSGESRATLVLAQRSPVFDAEKITGILGISAEELIKCVNAYKE